MKKNLRFTCQGVVAIDATYLTGMFRGYLFTAVCKDANNEILLLAHGRYHKETAASWASFVQSLRLALDPQKERKFLILCDHAKGLQTLSPEVEVDPGTDEVTIVRWSLHLENCHFSRCTRHLIEQNSVDFMKKLNLSVTEEMRQLMWGMAKATTRESYLSFWDSLGELSEKLAEWMDERRHQYATNWQSGWMSDGISMLPTPL